jgi:hypothetical protein
MRLASGVTPLFLVATAVWAQPASIGAQETGRALQLLHSPLWVDKAWGAYFAGRLHAEDLQEPLIEEFRLAAALRNEPAGEEHAFVAALFDAAIEADISVPAPVLEPFEENWTAPVLILLAHSQDGEDPLLRLSAAKADLAWLAANNLLFEMKSPRWYASTLGAVNITHRFTVKDRDEGLGIGGGSGGGFCGDGVGAMPKGFPPVALYELQDSRERGSIVLARGPKDVYYKRIVVPADKQVGFGSCGSAVDRIAIRIGYLAGLVNMPAHQAEDLFHRETAIRYQGNEEFEREVEQSLEAQEQGIRSLVRTAKERGLECAPGMSLRIVPEVIDRRQNAADRLPLVAPREIVLQ